MLKLCSYGFRSAVSKAGGSFQALSYVMAYPDTEIQRLVIFCQVIQSKFHCPQSEGAQLIDKDDSITASTREKYMKNEKKRGFFVSSLLLRFFFFPGNEKDDQAGPCIGYTSHGVMFFLLYWFGYRTQTRILYVTVM